MKKFTLLTAVLMLVAPAMAADITWEGLNSNGTSLATDMNDAANWSSNVPGTGDSAIINFAGYAGFMGDLFIDATDTNFNPTVGLTFNASQNPFSYSQISDLYLDKSLTLSGDFATTGYPGSSGREANRFRLGTQAMGVTLNIGGNLDISQPNSPSWAQFRMGIGDANPGNSAVINLTGASTLFATPSNGYGASILSTAVPLENATNDMAPQMRFTNVGGTVTLQQAGQRTGGAIALGYVALDARSDQTWTCDELAFVTMSGNAGDGQFGRYIVESIDGGDLTNMGQLNIRINGNQTTANTATTAMRLKAGNYGSLWMNSAGTSGRSQRIAMTGDVNLMRQAVVFDINGDPVVSGYSLILRNDAGNSDGQYLDTVGFDLTLEHSLKLEDAATTVATASYVVKPLVVDPAGGSLIIKGDVLMAASPERSPEIEAGGSGNFSNRLMGIEGGANGVLTVGGNWDVRVGSRNGTNQSDSTVTLTGDANTFEVADADTLTGVQTNSWSVKTLNIGSASDAATIQLVNDYINNNPVAGDADADKVGEKLIVGTLNINANSTLDVNGQFVEISPNTLLIDSTGTLDLNTGLTLTDGQILTNFYGLTDQTTEWNALSGQVIDSDNLTFDFAAVYNGGANETYWQAVAVPEPATMGLLAIGGIALLRRRRLAKS